MSSRICSGYQNWTTGQTQLPITQPASCRCGLVGLSASAFSRTRQSQTRKPMPAANSTQPLRSYTCAEASRVCVQRSTSASLLRP